MVKQDWFARVAQCASILTFIFILIAFIMGVVFYVKYNQIIADALDTVDQLTDSSHKYLTLVEKVSTELQHWSEQIRKNVNLRDIKQVAINEIRKMPNKL